MDKPGFVPGFFYFSGSTEFGLGDSLKLWVYLPYSRGIHLRNFRMKLFKLATLTLAVGIIGGCAQVNSRVDEEVAYHTYLTASDRQIKVQVQSGETTFSGGGVWLGNGEVLTALHLFYQPPRIPKESDRIVVFFDGRAIPAKIVFHGDLPDRDLALLKVDPRRTPSGLARLAIPSVCSDVEPIGAPLYITAYDSVYSTTASPDGAVMYKGKTWSQSATAIVSHGVSGSPVFDKQTSCLAGIVSRLELSPHGNMADPKQVACEKATLQMNDAGQGITCAVTPQTIFTTADTIAEFLKEARAYEDSHGSEQSLAK
ncbi:serine protease [Paraburkholderia sp. SIMBA_054]|uniref:S1 family peptidase n=1 Tax=Paraburkholderia sp. SIMBA_054 TaxID=3085795 RepID=UPI00397AE101